MRFLLLISLLTATNLFAQTPRIDLSSVESYWKVADALQQNRPASEQLWQQFCDLPGTKLTVTGRGIDLKLLRQALEIVYQPAQESLKQRMLADTSQAFDQKRYYVQLHSRYQQQRQQLEAYARQARSGQLLTAAYQLTYQVLPASFRQTRKTVPNLEIYYSPLFEGGYADGNRMVLALETEYAFREKKPNLIVGHELHHLLRPRVGLKAVNTTDSLLLTIFDKLLDEGTADLVGIKPADYKAIKPTEPVQKIMGDDPFLWYLDGADTVLTNLNQNLTRYYQTNDTSWLTPARFETLLVSSGGHIPSGFMGHVIDRNGLRPQLIAQLTNPFAFVRLYNRAAQNDPSKPPLFSPEVIALATELEKKYFKR